MVLETATKTLYYPGFSNGTINSCKLNETSSSTKAADQPDKIYPEEAKQNFLVLLICGVRLIFAKAVASNAILTIRALIM